MDESDLTETLDRRGLLDAARGPGTYALEVNTPDSAEAVARRWLEYNDASFPNPERIATAETVLYVGASGNVYDRLCDHVAAEVRKASFLTAFRPVDVAGVWPTDTAEGAFDDEYNRAVTLADADTRVWMDGALR